jgi:hypothetical protein
MPKFQKLFSYPKIVLCLNFGFLLISIIQPHNFRVDLLRPSSLSQPAFICNALSYLQEHHHLSDPVYVDPHSYRLFKHCISIFNQNPSRAKQISIQTTTPLSLSKLTHSQPLPTLLIVKSNNQPSINIDIWHQPSTYSVNYRCKEVFSSSYYTLIKCS